LQTIRAIRTRKGKNISHLITNQKKLRFHKDKRQYLKSSTLFFVLIEHNPCICTYTMDQVLLSIMQVVEYSLIRCVVKEIRNHGNKQVYEDFEVSFFAQNIKVIWCVESPTWSTLNERVTIES
jgi:hypothetical protein